MEGNQNISELMVTEINESVFFKEFTFDKNEFCPDDGKKELADNILIIDDLLFVIQIKERSTEKAKTTADQWFRNKILKIAKNQVKMTIEYLVNYDSIPIKNRRNQTIDVSKVKVNNINKLIIYKCDDELKKEYEVLKFYKSKTDGLIHVFSISNYHYICKILVTPAELDEYLKFREELYLNHREFIMTCSEQYIIAHFINSDNAEIIDLNFLTTFFNYDSDLNTYEMSDFVDAFQEMLIPNQSESNNYHFILTEVAKLKRYELSQFKKRYFRAIDKAKKNEFSFPFRFYNYRTDCAFIFLPLSTDLALDWEEFLINFTEVYKYKRKATKAVGVVCYKKDAFTDVNWVMFNNKWKYDEELEKLLVEESSHYENGKITETPRYKFNL